MICEFIKRTESVYCSGALLTLRTARNAWNILSHFTVKFPYISMTFPPIYVTLKFTIKHENWRTKLCSIQVPLTTGEYWKLSVVPAAMWTPA